MKPVFAYIIKQEPHYGHISVIKDVLRVYQPEVLYLLVAEGHVKSMNEMLRDACITPPEVSVINYSEQVFKWNLLSANVVMIREYVHHSTIPSVDTSKYQRFTYLYVPAPKETAYRFETPAPAPAPVVVQEEDEDETF